MIRKALVSDIKFITKLVKACAKEMIANGIYQWNEEYPTRDRFLKDIELQELYVLEKEGQILGTIVITKVIDQEYIPIKWLTGNGVNLYIHRLVVSPEFWGKGYAQKLMSWAETYGLEKGFTSIRLDTFSQNKRNQRFYEIRGYQRLGNIYFPKQSEYPFYCYELIL